MVAEAFLAAAGRVTDQAMRRWLKAEGSPSRLNEAMGYSLLAGGKRLRPALVLGCYQACGGGRAGVAVTSAMLAVEMIHTFSLIHDDLPAMDDDDLRRGKPTNHKVFGQALAILAGDALNTAAFGVLAKLPDKKLASALVQELATATAGRGMIGGQVLDIESENKPLTLAQLQKLHALKTGALLVASCRMGALCAGAKGSSLAAATAYGRHLGLAFQITDDILDETATAEQLGKATKKDAARGKNTYPKLLGLDGAVQAARRESLAAIRAASKFGTKGKILSELSAFVGSRTH
jgi:geranylgeranyl diphosphate synthase type II